ncbi:hypothetical protein LL13F57_42290 [Escherichia coli]
MYSLIGTCKLKGVDPERYLHNVLDVIADRPVNRGGLCSRGGLLSLSDQLHFVNTVLTVRLLK